jgi:hypothetical protein
VKSKTAYRKECIGFQESDLLVGKGLNERLSPRNELPGVGRKRHKLGDEATREGHYKMNNTRDYIHVDP